MDSGYRTISRQFNNIIIIVYTVELIVTLPYGNFYFMILIIKCD